MSHLRRPLVGASVRYPWRCNVAPAAARSHLVRRDWTHFEAWVLAAMLWTLLIAIGSLNFLGGTMVWARFQTRSMQVYALASTLGLAMTVGNFWLWSRVAEVLATRMGKSSESARERVFGLLYIAAVVWMPVATALGYWITRGVTVLL